MPAIEAITDELLIAAIQRANDRVVMIAPGISALLADAVAQTWKRLGKDRVTAILDVDPEICRIGYGSLKGLEILQGAAAEMGEAIGQEPGVRICVFIIDEETFVFSPTPRQLEVAPGEKAAAGETSVQANGLVLSTPPPAMQKALGAGPEGQSCRSLGLKALRPERIQQVKKDLEQNPPRSFDLSRAVNVYNAKIQFAEFKVTGCRFSGQKAKLPGEILKVLRNNPVLDGKIEKSLRLLEEDDKFITDNDLSERTIFTQRKKLENKYLVHVKGGTVILREKKAAFGKEVEKLQSLISQFSARVAENLDERYRSTADQLSMALLDDVMRDIPQKWLRDVGPTPDPGEVKFLIRKALLKAFGEPERRVAAMKTSLVFKDVTYDMLKDEEFRAQIHKHFPELPLMEEYKAAKERPPAPAPPLTDTLF